MFALRKNSRAWLIWGLAASFFFAEYFARVAPSVMVPNLMRDFHVTALSLGALSAYFYYAYVGMQIPVGTLIDRFGPHKLLTVTAAICGGGCLIFANTHSLHAAELGRLMMGFGAAFAFVGALKLASVWFPASRFGFLAGTTQALGMLGAAVGEGPVSILVLHYGWRNTMMVIGAVLLLIALLIGIIVRDKPSLSSISSMNAPAQKYSLLGSLIKVLQNPQTWINAGFIGFLYAPTAAFAELWGVSYIHRVHGIDREIAASAVSLIFIGWAIGSPIAGRISDRIKRRKPILIVSALLSLFFISIALYLPHIPVALLFVVLFLYGMSNVGVATSYAVACEINPKAVAATSMSFANMASVLIGALFQPTIGWLLDLHWNHKMVHDVPYYSAHDFQFALAALPLCLVVSLIFGLILKESYNTS